MKKLIVSLLALALVLTGCGSNNKTDDKKSDKVYTYVYSTDPDSFDYVTTGYASNSEHLANFVDGLLEANSLGQLVGALAESYEYNADATEITFHLKKGVKWYTAEGVEYAEVKADDFVAGLQHAADFDSDAFYMVEYTIEGLEDYYKGVTTDFSTVGVKAVDDYTLTYTLTEPTPYFHTMTTYGVLYPINREFLESQGTGCKLGAADPATCSFGAANANAILYNGAFLLSNFTPKSVIEYKVNPNYYDLENVHISGVKLIYSDGSDPDSYFRGFDAGTYTQAPVYTDNDATYALAQEKYGDSIYTGKLTSTSFYWGFNLDRNSFASPADPTAAVTTKTEKQIADTKKAVLNVNFRKAILYGMDRTAFLAQRSGEALKTNALRNTITMPEFVSTSDGKSYAQLLSEALAARNSEWTGVDLSDSQDPYYNPELAKKYAAKAKEELAAQGVEFPVVMEQVYDQTAEKGIRMQQALAASIESTLGSDFIDIVTVLTDSDNANYSDYLARTADKKNFDFSTSVGWGPDYGDPRTYVDILDADTGAILSNVGLNYTGKEVGDDAAAKAAVGYDEFQELLHKANAIVDDNDARYAAYAAAEAWIIDNAILIPMMSQGGLYAVSKVVPYTVPYSFYGLSDSKYKYLEIQDEVVTLAQRDAAKAEWEAARAGK